MVHPVRVCVVVSVYATVNSPRLHLFHVRCTTHVC